MSNEINKQLRDLYQQKWTHLSLLLQDLRNDKEIDVKPANPLLLYVQDEVKYDKSDLKVMFLGQETNGWYEEKLHPSVADLQKLYDNFFNSGQCWSYAGQFWNGIKRLRQSLNDRLPDIEIEFVWNNLIKIGKEKEKGLPPDFIYEIERNHFKVLGEEIKILRPDLIIFFTGPNYDGIIYEKFGDLKFSECSLFTNRELAKIDFPNVEYCFRTYHPNYLWRNNIDDFIESITEHIVIGSS